MPTSILNTEEIRVSTDQRNQMIEVTAQIQELVRAKRIEDAIIYVYSPHTTAGVCIQENADPDVRKDLLAKLEQLIPKSESFYRHGEGNSDSHLKTVLTGSSATLFATRGKLALGQWQGVYLCEFDGPRERTLWVRIVHQRVQTGDRD